jgi:hypothetical protein
MVYYYYTAQSKFNRFHVYNNKVNEYRSQSQGKLLHPDGLHVNH